MKPVADCLTSFHASLGAGTSETSGYPALANLEVRPDLKGLDIHLNATTRWKDVPEAVWHYTLGRRSGAALSKRNGGI